MKKINKIILQLYSVKMMSDMIILDFFKKIFIILGITKDN